MSFFDSFLGGAAGAGANIINQQMQDEQKLKAQEQLARLNEELMTQREKAIAGWREAAGIRAEERAQEREEGPLKRMGGIISSKMNQEVPIEAAPVTNLSGQGVAVDGQPLKSGLKGDPAKMREIAMGMPDGEDKTNMLKQIDSQMATDTATNQSAVAGKTRKMSAEEAQKAALNDAMANDPVAYAAYQKNIGKPLRDERKEDLREKKIDADSVDRNKRMDWQQEFQTRQLSQQKELQELQYKKQDASETKNEERARLSALNKIADDQSKDIKELRVRLGDPLIDESMKAMYTIQMQEAMATHKQAITQLSGIAGLPEKPVEAAKVLTFDPKTGKFK